MKEKFEIPTEEQLKVIRAIGTKHGVHRLKIWKKVGGRLNPSFSCVMNYLSKIGAILEVSADRYALHPVFDLVPPEVALRACYPLVRHDDGKGVVVWTNK